MIRAIVGFHADEARDWVAELSCGHNQHIRHDPPFHERPWVLSEAGREQHCGSEIDCPPCDRAELPEGLTRVRQIGPFDETSLPAGLLRAHRIGPGTWGLLEIHQGQISLALPEGGPEVVLSAGHIQALPPEAPHRLSLRGPVVLTIEFLVPTPG